MTSARNPFSFRNQLVARMDVSTVCGNVALATKTPLSDSRSRRWKKTVNAILGQTHARKISVKNYMFT